MDNDWAALTQYLSDSAALAAIVAVDEGLIFHLSQEIEVAESNETGCQGETSMRFILAARGWSYYRSRLATILEETRAHQKQAADALTDLLKDSGLAV